MLKIKVQFIAQENKKRVVWQNKNFAKQPGSINEHIYST